MRVKFLNQDVLKSVGSEPRFKWLCDALRLKLWPRESKSIP